MGGDKAQVNRLIKELVNQDLITKNDNQKDKRSQLLTLSAKGNEIIILFKTAEKYVFDKMANDITIKKLKTLFN
jgi:DNA-binding MarR family transcriptional regulator